MRAACVAAVLTPMDTSSAQHCSIPSAQEVRKKRTRNLPAEQMITCADMTFRRPWTFSFQLTSTCLSKHKAMEFWLTSYLHLTPRWHYHLNKSQDYTLEQAASAGKGQSKQQGTKTSRGVRRDLSHISAVTSLTAWFSPEPPQPSGMDSVRDFQPRLSSQSLFT